MTHYKKHKLTKRKDGRWQLKFRYNKKDYYAYGKTQKECCNKFDEMRKNIKNQPITKMTFFKWLDIYVDVYKKENKTQYETYRQIKYHIKPNLKDFPIEKLNPIVLDKLIMSIKHSRTRKAIYTILHNALNIAYQKRVTRENYADFLTKVVHTSEEGHRLIDDEIVKIFENVENEVVKKLFYFYLYTGVRKTEALTLRYCDIDFVKALIHIRGTKTEKSNRLIPLFENLKKILIPSNSEELVFEVSESTIAREIRKIKGKTNIDFSIKDFRTTFASACHERQIDDYTIKYWLGHTSIATTQKHYIKYDASRSTIDAKLTINMFEF